MNQSAGASGTSRNYQMDNLKCLLIFAVVFGHMLELFMGKDPGNKLLYLVIYSFHMPLFAFVTGVFARYNPEKIKNHMIYPYLIFQTLYVVFANQVLEKEADVQYTTPYWLLWYLFAIIVWNLVLPLVQGGSAKKKLLLLAVSFAGSILIGFDDKAGYYLSVSRIVQFFPYFLLGTYYRDLKASFKSKTADVVCERRNLDEHQKVRLKKAAKIILTAVCMAAVSLFILFMNRYLDEIHSAWLYGSMSYDKGDYSYRFRILSIAGALLWLGVFVLCMPQRRLPFLSYIGANTMPVYLLHGFLIKLLSKGRFFSTIEHDRTVALLLSCVFLLVLSWKPLVRFLSPLFRFDREDYRLLWKRRGRQLNKQH